MLNFLVESQVICIILLMILGVYSFRFDHGMKWSLKGIYILTALAAVADIASNLLLFEEFFAMSRVTCCVYYSIWGAVGYLWLLYATERMNKKLSESRVFKIIGALPMVLNLVINVIYWMVAVVGEFVIANRVCFVHRIHPAAICVIYALVVCLIACVSLKKAHGKRRKQEILLLGVLSVIPVIAGALELKPTNLMMMPYAVTILLLILFIYTQHQRLRIDNLTRLSNRYGMDDEIFLQLEQYKRDKNDLFYVIACDLDNFKHINDTWGHQEGDRALKLISNVLMDVAERYDASAFRIGGDEFVIFVDVSEDTIPKEMCSVLKTELDNIDFRDDFDIRMSVGLARYDGKTSVSELLNSADKELYEAKRKTKV